MKRISTIAFKVTSLLDKAAAFPLFRLKSTVFTEAMTHKIADAEREADINNRIFGVETHTANKPHTKNGIKGIKVVSFSEDGGFDLIDWAKKVPTTLYGRTPAHSIEPLDKLSHVERLQLVLNIASNIAALHAHGYAHCDIKFENIVRNYQGDIRLIDFEGAHLAGTRTPKGKNPKRTERYAAPEIYEDQSNITLEADLYALGVLIDGLFPGLWKKIDPNSESNKGAKTPFEHLLVSLLSMDPKSRGDIGNVIRRVSEEIINISSKAPLASYGGAGATVVEESKTDEPAKGNVSLQMEEQARIAPNMHALYQQVVKEKLRLLKKNKTSTTGLKLETLAIDILSAMQHKNDQFATSSNLRNLAKRYDDITLAHTRTFTRNKNTSCRKNAVAFWLTHSSLLDKPKRIASQSASSMTVEDV